MSRALLHEVITSVETTERSVTAAAAGVGEQIFATLSHVLGSTAEHMLTFENPPLTMVRIFQRTKNLAPNAIFAKEECCILTDFLSSK